MFCLGGHTLRQFDTWLLSVASPWWVSNKSHKGSSCRRNAKPICNRRFVTPRLEGLRILERSRILRPSRSGVTKRTHNLDDLLSPTFSFFILYTHHSITILPPPPPFPSSLLPQNLPTSHFLTTRPILPQRALAQRHRGLGERKHPAPCAALDRHARRHPPPCADRASGRRKGPHTLAPGPGSGGGNRLHRHQAHPGVPCHETSVTQFLQVKLTGASLRQAAGLSR
eukprot:COSAG01_NODE_3004_length_6735_cov_44.599759_7_plen_226_part_00